MFPRLPPLNWSTYAVVASLGVLVCYALETAWWSYLGCLGLVVAVMGWSVFAARRLQMGQFRYVKMRGLDMAWEQREAVREHMTPSTFQTLYESRLYNAQWRHEFLAMLGQASWIGITDHFTQPHTFRWELRCVPPSTWDADDRFCVYIALLACLPDRHPYELRIDEHAIEIKNGAAFTPNVPRAYTEAPAVTMQFWNFFQRHMNVLMDTHIAFNPPVFEYGLAVDVDMNFPAEFLLIDGGALHVREENERICVRVVDARGVLAREQEYATPNAFWWVWRNAIAPTKEDGLATEQSPADRAVEG